MIGASGVFPTLSGRRIQAYCTPPAGLSMMTSAIPSTLRSPTPRTRQPVPGPQLRRMEGEACEPDMAKTRTSPSLGAKVSRSVLASPLNSPKKTSVSAGSPAAISTGAPATASPAVSVVKRETESAPVAGSKRTRSVCRLLKRPSKLGSGVGGTIFNRTR